MTHTLALAKGKVNSFELNVEQRKKRKKVRANAEKNQVNSDHSSKPNLSSFSFHSLRKVLMSITLLKFNAPGLGLLQIAAEDGKTVH